MPVLEARTAFKRSSLIRKSATLPRSALHKQAPFSRLTVKAARPRLTSRVSQQKSKVMRLAGGDDGSAGLDAWSQTSGVPTFRLRV